jgi:hypothetical protein
MDRIQLINRSLRCFTLGCLSLIPLAGIPLALITNSEFRRITKNQGDQWNPAGSYLVLGRRLAWAGLLISLLTFALAAVVVYQIQISQMDKGN